MKFWDTSAVLPLIFDEPHSRAARSATQATRCYYAWSWLKVEAHAGLTRRNATAAQWNRLSELLSVIHWIEIPEGQIDALCRANRKWRLRAGDAGHLFCFQQVSYAIPDIELVCFDDEITTAAAVAGLRLWKPPQGASPPSSVRERPVPYGRRTRHRTGPAGAR